MPKRFRLFVRTVSLVCGILLSVLVFQNCAPGGLEALNQDKLSSSGGVTPESTTVVVPSVSGKSSVVVNNQSVNIGVCSADDSRLVLEISGGGAGMQSCVEPYIPGRSNSFRCADSSYQSLSVLAGWSYDAQKDIWYYSEKLKSHNSFVPGLYKTFFKANGEIYQYSYEIGNPAAANCLTPAPSPSPGPVVTPTPGTDASDPRNVTYGTGKIITNQFGRVLVKDATAYSYFDHGSSGNYDVISYKIDYNWVQSRSPNFSGRIQVSSVRYNGSGGNRIHTISSIPGDTAVSDVCGGHGRYQRDVSIRGVYGAEQAGYCQLVPGQTYFLNVKMQVPCSSLSDSCKFHLNFGF